MALFGRWRAAAKHRETRRELCGLDAHMLRDIGIRHEVHEGQIDWQPHHAANRRA